MIRPFKKELTYFVLISPSGGWENLRIWRSRFRSRLCRSQCLQSNTSIRFADCFEICMIWALLHRSRLNSFANLTIFSPRFNFVRCRSNVQICSKNVRNVDVGRCFTNVDKLFRYDVLMFSQSHISENIILVFKTLPYVLIFWFSQNPDLTTRWVIVFCWRLDQSGSLSLNKCRKPVQYGFQEFPSHSLHR